MVKRRVTYTREIDTEHMAAIGRKGGKARAAAMSPEKRKAAAVKAAKAHQRLVDAGRKALQDGPYGP